MTEKLLRVENLSAHFDSYEGTAYVLDGVSFEVAPGEIMGIVGETGCGKSVTGLSVLRLLPRNGRIVSGDIDLAGGKLLEMSKKEMADIRGKRISMIFQHPQSSLNPVISLGKQLTAIIQNKMAVPRSHAVALAVEMFEKVGLPDPEYLLSKYPHELSGGCSSG